MSSENILRNFNKERLIQHLIIIFAFSIPLSRGLISTFTLILPLVWIVLSYVEGSIKEDIHRLIETRMAKTILVFLALYLVSLLWSGGPTYWHARMHHFSFLAFIFPIVVMRLNYSDVGKIISAFLLGMLISEIVSYGIFFEFLHYKSVTPGDPSPFMAHIEYSTLLAFSALLLLSRVYFEKKIKLKFFYLLFFISITINLFINGGRTGQVAFILGLLLLTIVSFKHKFLALLLAVSLTTGILITAWSFSENFHRRASDILTNIDTVLHKNDVCSSVGQRVANFSLAYEVFKENPVLGAGWMGHEKLQKDVVAAKFPGWKCVIYGHLDFQNQFLLVMVEFGIVGLVLFLMIFYYLLKLPLESQHFKNLRTIFIAVMLMYFFSEGLVHHFTGSFFAMMLGLFVVVSRHADNNVSTAESISTESKVFMQS